MSARHYRLILVLAAGAIFVAARIVPGFLLAVASPLPLFGLENDSDATALHLSWRTINADTAKPAVEISGADPVTLSALSHPSMTRDRWTSFFNVRVVPASAPVTEELPPLWGSYGVTSNVVRFEPRFPLEPGLKYRAEVDPLQLHLLVRELARRGLKGLAEPRSRAKVIAEYAIPTKRAPVATRITAVYPSPDVLPENLLRFYIAFSGPMSRREAYRRITLVDGATAKPIESPFLELDEELWSPDGTRFTLLVDPGRIKRGLRPREEVGPVLEAGKSYSLIIDGGWPDASGNALQAGFRKSFRAVAPDETSPDPKMWTLHSPRANSLDPLELGFPEPLDRALLERLITVEDARGTRVRGKVSVETSETSWRFTPEQPWSAGDHRVVVGTELEDVAGNSVARPFEVDADGPISLHLSASTIALPFRITAPRR